jgi:heme/copper-type cytochrome/quinol oxidase subunit 2
MLLSVGAPDGEGIPAHGGRRSAPKAMIAVAVVAVLVVAGVAAYYSGYFGTGQQSTGTGIMNANCSQIGNPPVPEHDVTAGNASHVYFLIVEADYPSPYAGINGSANEPANATWPVMRVHLGQVVSIHVINCASSEAHGFEVEHYDDRVVNAIPQGGHYDVTFTANEAGTFRVYCSILCAVHPLMQNGEFVVS